MTEKEIAQKRAEFLWGFYQMLLKNAQEITDESNKLYILQQAEETLTRYQKLEPIAWPLSERQE